MLGHDAEVTELRHAPTSTFAPAVSPSWVPFPPEILTCLEKPSPPTHHPLPPHLFYCPAPHLAPPDISSRYLGVFVHFSVSPARP